MHITINDCKIFFDTYGSKLKVLPDRVLEKPTLIVLHGAHGFLDHVMYVEFWSQFADLAQVIFIDQRGCGRSDHRHAAEWNLATWCEDLYQFCQILQIEKPIVAGISMGGHVMCELVKRYPDLASGLIFCHTEARVVLDDVCAELEKRGGKTVADYARQQFLDPTPEHLALYLKHCVPYYSKNAYTPTEIARCIPNHAVFNHYCKNEMLTFNYLDQLHKIHCPTLLLAGADSPLHVIPRVFEMAEHIDPRYVSIEIIANAGTPVYKEQPEKSYQIVKRFLERC